jgi:hypothetical protein
MTRHGYRALIPAVCEDDAMADEEKPASSGAPILTTQVIPASGPPPPGIPVAFADGVSNFAQSKFVVKFYLFRTDPDVAGGGPSQNNIVTQVVMPIEGFVRSAIYLIEGWNF